MKGVREYLRENMNIPNSLTLLRVLLIPVFIWLYSRGMRYASLCVFVLASLTDLFDGMLARKLNQVTSFGKLFDPLADKLMVLTAMFAQAISGVLPWAAVIIVLAKEALMVLGGAVMLRRGIVVHSVMIGKTAHFILIVALVASFFHEWFMEKLPELTMTPDIMLLWGAVALTLVSLYINAAWALRRIREG